MRFTMKLKLAIAFGFVIALLLGTAGYRILGLGNLNRTVENVLQGPAARLKLAQQIHIHQLQAIRQQKNLLASTSEASIAFFKVDGSNHVGKAKRPLPKAITKVSTTKPVANRRPAAAGNSVAAQQARAKGFALDLSMVGPDAEDADFRESA